MSVKIQQLVDAVKHLADLHAKPLLALKAYDSILCDSVDPKYFYDYILHCNAFALGELSRKPLDANLARDYFRLALEQFAARGVQWREDEVEDFLEVDQCAPGQGHEAGPSEGLGQFVESDVEDDLETCPCPLSIPDGMDDASLALLSLTLSNWACLEFCARNAKKAYALFELSSVAAAATLEPASPFGYRMEVAKVINRGVCQIMYCNFPEAEEILDATIPPLLEQRAALRAAVTIAENATASGSGEADRDESAIQDVIDPVPEGQEDKLLLDVSCLCGLSYYALGVAQEYGACEGAIGTYETALEYLTSVLAPREGTPATEGEESPGNGVKVATPVIDSTEECAASPSSPGEEVVPVAAEAASQEEPSKELVCADKQATPVSEDPRIEQAAGAPEGAEHSSGAPDCQVDAVVAEIGDHNSSGTPEIQQDIPDTIEDGQNDILQIISTTRDILLSYVSAAKEKAAAAWAEEAAKRDAMRKFRRRASTKKGSKKRQSILPESMGIDVPAIKAPLRTYIRREGLTTISAPVLSLEHALHYLHPVNEALAEEGIVEKPFVSPFAGTRAESGSCCVAAVLLCTQTPLQLAVEVRQAEKHPLPPNSVWGPRRVIPTYLMPEKDFLEKELIAAGNAEKKPPPVLKSLMPRPMPQSSVSAAQKGVNTAMKLLSQRLQVLLKAEKQYEDRWTASERIFSALTSYYVPQEMMKLKETLLEKKRIKNFRENRSARILVRFFRRVLEEKPREFGFLCKDQRRALQEGNAATTLQKYARRWLAIQHRHRLECKRRETIQKICVVQSLFRRQVAQAYCEKLRREKQQAEEEKERMLAQHYAATQIQKVYRGHRTRLLLWYYSGDTRKAMLHHLHDSRHYYASQIQKRVRGMLCRRRYGRAVYFKRCYGRNVYRAQLLEGSSITIQRFYRGYRARRRYRSVILNRMKQIEENIEAQLKLEEDARAELEARVEFQAAARIQSTMRIKDATRHAEELRAARERAISSRKGEVYAPFNFDDCIF